jgi:transglutaminase-like putative cysteine protease
MKFNVASELTFNARTEGALILNIHALRTQHQAVISEEFTIDPYIKTEEIVSIEGNRLIRFPVHTPGTFKVTYKALIDNFFELIDPNERASSAPAALDPVVLPYLYPSRYCQSDKLYRLAHNFFGYIESPFEQVLALTNWIYYNVQYLSGSTNAQTSAFDTVTEQSGVCRDFAHLGIALCRALTIPARYFTGFAYSLKPADFHACFEAYIGGKWILFDATKLAPLNGLIKIGSGRDAADTALANIFGDIMLDYVQVSCELAEDGFSPYFYLDGQQQGITYL